MSEQMSSPRIVCLTCRGYAWKCYGRIVCEGCGPDGDYVTIYPCAVCGMAGTCAEGCHS